MEQIQQNHINNLDELRDGSSQCEYLLMLGMGKAPMESLRKNDFRIGGCKTAIWIRVGDETSHVEFASDSDSLLVRGVLSIFEEIYAGRTLSQIRAHPPDFLKHISDDVIYPEIKENGLLKCYVTIAAFNYKG